MASSYPNTLDTLATTKSDATAMATDHAQHHNNLADAVNKIEAEIGVTPRGAAASVAARLAGLDTADGSKIPKSLLNAKGDVIGATAAATPVILAVGANGQVLTADSTFAAGIKWATPAAGGGSSGIDGGDPSSIYGGTTNLDGGTA